MYISSLRENCAFTDFAVSKMKFYFVFCVLFMVKSCNSSPVIVEECPIYSVNSTEERFIDKAPNKQEELWILPKGKFQIFFTLEVDNLLTLNPSFVIDRKLTVTSEMLPNSTEDWVKLDLLVRKEEVSFSRDKIVIEVTMLRDSYIEILDLWWRLYSVKNVLISAAGDVEIAIGCRPASDSGKKDLFMTNDNYMNSLAYILGPILILIVLVPVIFCSWKMFQKQGYYWRHDLQSAAPITCNDNIKLEYQNIGEHIYEEIKIENIEKCKDKKPRIYIDLPSKPDILRGTSTLMEGVEFDNKFNHLMYHNGIYDVPPKKLRQTDSIYLDMNRSNSFIGDNGPTGESPRASASATMDEPRTYDTHSSDKTSRQDQDYP